MDLRAKIQKAVQKGLGKLGTIRVSCTYHVTGVLEYDANAGTHAETGGADYPVEVVFDRIQVRDPGDSPYPPQAKKALISALDLTVTPKPGDTLTDPAGVVWTVVGATGADMGSDLTDPAGALWTIPVVPGRGIFTIQGN